MIKCLQPRRQRCSPTNSSETDMSSGADMKNLSRRNTLPRKRKQSLMKKVKYSHCPESMQYIYNLGW